jgi:hypothetical protein
MLARGFACRRSVASLIASAVPVITLLSYAYDVPVNPSPRLSPLPDWTLREKYDIEAKAPANATPAVNPFAGLPTIFTVLGKLSLELKAARRDLAGIHSGAHRAPGRQL